MLAIQKKNMILKFRLTDWSGDSFIPVNAVARSVPPWTSKKKKRMFVNHGGPWFAVLRLLWIEHSASRFQCLKCASVWRSPKWAKAAWLLLEKFFLSQYLRVEKKLGNASWNGGLWLVELLGWRTGRASGFCCRSNARWISMKFPGS